MLLPQKTHFQQNKIKNRNSDIKLKEKNKYFPSQNSYELEPTFWVLTIYEALKQSDHGLLSRVAEWANTQIGIRELKNEDWTVKN